MKNRQFIVLCCLIVIGFILLRSKIDKVEKWIDLFDTHLSTTMDLLKDKLDVNQQQTMRVMYDINKKE
jgi:hypothetical protein